MFKIGINVGVAFMVAFGGSAAVFAQTAPGVDAGSPDKSSYSLFNPTPDDQLRDLCTDRPPKANLPCTVDPGHFQYESDVFNWSRSVSGGATTDTFLYTNPTLKVGLTNTIDLEANMAPSERVVTKSASGQQGFEGLAIFMFAARSIWRAGRRRFSIGHHPYIKAPTGAPGVSNRAAEGGLIAPVSFALPQGFTLLFDPEFDMLRTPMISGITPISSSSAISAMR